MTNHNSLQPTGGETIDYSPSALAEDVWLFLTDETMPEVSTIKKEALLHEVTAVMTTIIARKDAEIKILNDRLKEAHEIALEIQEQIKLLKS